MPTVQLSALEDVKHVHEGDYTGLTSITCSNSFMTLSYLISLTIDC